jgi:K+-transporting ATPase ATPase C chain
MRQVAARKDSLLRSSQLSGVSQIPVDLLFASASGLDPDISPEAALFQVDRVLQGRQLDIQHRNALIQLIDSHTERRDLGVLGEPRVNVLLLNLALDSLITRWPK